MTHISKPFVTLRECIADDIQCFGYFEAAKLRSRKICFTHYYFLAFGRLPRI